MINFFNNPYNGNTNPSENNQPLDEKIILRRQNAIVSNESNKMISSNESKGVYNEIKTNDYLKNNEKEVRINLTTDFETLQKARQDLVGEIQAVIEYDEHIRNTNNQFAKETWENIKHEELSHAGELMGLINYLDPTQKQYVQHGWNEFNERLIKK